jgi:Zn-dependent protease with chaperone function/tetratricopeptide (TPR) repeat protein
MRNQVIVVLLVVGASGQSAYEREYQRVNDQIHAELKAIDPEAESMFAAADAAKDRLDYQAASDLYARVFARVPTFSTALRRQAGAEGRMGHRTQAITLALRAVQLDRSSDNVAALASMTLIRTPESKPSADEIKSALGLAREAVRLDHDNLYAQMVHANAALASSSLTDLDAVIGYLDVMAPKDANTFYYRTISSLSHGDFDRASAMLEQAHAAGLPDDAYRSTAGAISKAQPVLPRVARWGGITAGAWVAGGLLLFASGMTLSALTLKQSGHVPADPDAGPTAFESGLRRAYRFVLGICCIYYYVSLPIILALVLVVGGGLIYEMLTVGHIPIKLILIVFVVTVVTGWSILKSLIVRSNAGDPGERLDLEREPALRDVLVKVAGNVGTRPVDTVFLTPGTEVAVFERGGLLRQLAGKPERCLILGAGVLEGMSLRPFQAVLAHEYGHFSNRDTAGGGLALSVRRSVVALATNLAKNGAADWYNPAWIFVNGFHRVFQRISQGASRLQEVLADRWAAILYGAQSFEDGLRHVIDRGVRFNAHVNATIKEVVEAKQPLPNLYQYRPAASGDAKQLDDAVQSQIDRDPSPYDSHPRPADRFRWVHALNAPTSRSVDDASPVWSLFQERDAIEQRMTSVIRDAVSENHGVRIEG